MIIPRGQLALGFLKGHTMTPYEKYDLLIDTLKAVSELGSARPIHVARKVAQKRNEKFVKYAKEKRYKRVWDALNSGFFTNCAGRYTLNEKGKAELDSQMSYRQKGVIVDKKHHLQEKKEKQEQWVIHDLFENEQQPLSTLSQVSDRFTTAGLELRMLVDELKSLISKQHTVNQRMLHLIKDA